MERYIDAEKAIEAIYDLPNCPNGYSDTYDKECIIGTIEEVPTADVVPKERIVEFITNKLTEEISERLIRVLEENYEIIPKKPVLVRCKDCKWFNDFGCAIRIVDESDKPKEDDFCSFGERRK